jgi:hypothetical protein
MPRNGFEICNHTCGCIELVKRPDSMKECTIFQKEGSSGRRHAKSSRNHPHCTAQCPAYRGGILTREPTPQEWLKWTPCLVQAFSHRPDLLTTIPTFASTPSSQNFPRAHPLKLSQDPSNATHKDKDNRLPPNIRRKKPHGQRFRSAIYIVDPASSHFRPILLPKSLEMTLRKLCPPPIRDVPNCPNYYLTPESVSKESLF